MTRIGNLPGPDSSAAGVPASDLDALVGLVAIDRPGPDRRRAT